MKDHLPRKATLYIFSSYNSQNSAIYGGKIDWSAKEKKWWIPIIITIGIFIRPPQITNLFRETLCLEMKLLQPTGADFIFEKSKL